jgi:outer membrane lipoprotein-sorting protein
VAETLASALQLNHSYVRATMILPDATLALGELDDHMQTSIRVVLFGLCFGGAFAQTQPDVAEILQRVTEAYKNVSQYEVEVSATVHDTVTNQDVLRSMRFVFKAPDKYRLETKGDSLAPGMSKGGPAIDEAVMVYDGSKLWAYSPKSNEYRVYVAPQLPRDSSPPAADLYMGIGLYRRADQTFSRARLLREETISADGGKADCFVLTQDPPGRSGTLWIEKNTYHVLQMGDASGMAVFKNVKLNDPLSDDLFKFKPPRGARKVEGPAH